MMNRRFTSAVAGVLVGAFALGCSEVPTGINPEFALGDRNDTYEVIPGAVNVCAIALPTALSATYNAEFTATATGGDVLSSFNITHAPPLCIEAWNATSSTPENVTVSLPTVPAGIMVERIVVLRGNDAVATNLVGATSATVNGVSDTNGAYVWFKIDLFDTPPGGGQGCTPGYWKQSQHFGSWTGYAPTDLFSTVFGSSVFGSKTLLQVVSQGGGGLNALGRHSVAALLNAASAGVDYDLSVQQVIDGFNAAVAAGGSQIEYQKNLLDMLNNQGCGLGRNP